MRLPRFPDAAATTAPASAPDDVFPGVLHGTKAGDFGGLPPVPGEVTARVPELAIRLSAIAETLAVAHHTIVSHAELQALAIDASRRLHALADELAAEGGDQ